MLVLRRVLRLARMETVIWQICSNRSGKKVPQSARLSEGGLRGDANLVGASLRAAWNLDVPNLNFLS